MCPLQQRLFQSVQAVYRQALAAFSQGAGISWQHRDNSHQVIGKNLRPLGLSIMPTLHLIFYFSPTLIDKTRQFSSPCAHHTGGDKWQQSVREISIIYVTKSLLIEKKKLLMIAKPISFITDTSEKLEIKQKRALEFDNVFEPGKHLKYYRLI